MPNRGEVDAHQPGRKSTSMVRDNDRQNNGLLISSVVPYLICSTYLAGCDRREQEDG